MTTYVRVKQNETGHELSLSLTQYEWAPDAYELLASKDATDAGGNPLPAKYKTTVAKSAAAKRATSGHQAESSEGEGR
jgi:hypothetical protein